MLGLTLDFVLGLRGYFYTVIFAKPTNSKYFIKHNTSLVFFNYITSIYLREYSVYCVYRVFYGNPEKFQDNNLGRIRKKA